MKKYTYKQLADGSVSVYQGRIWCCFAKNMTEARQIFEPKVEDKFHADRTAKND